MSKVVLAGVDEHPTARDAVALAAALAAATHDELAVAHVYPADPLADAVSLDAPPGDPLRDEAIDIVRRVIADTAPAARIAAVPARSVAHGMHLRAAADGAELIVVGSSHRGAIGRATLGSHATRIVHGAPCAVAIAPAGLAQRGVRLRSIAVALDGSDEAADALAFARRLAVTTTADLRLVTVAPPQIVEWGRYRSVPDPEGYEERARAQAERVLAVARSGEETDIRPGSPATALLEVTDGVDLLVLGSRSYGPARRLLLGSVSDAVIRGSRCPLVVMPRSAR